VFDKGYMRYLPQKIEKKWQRKWLAAKTYEPYFAKATKGKPDLPARPGRRVKKPFYNLMMFPYPSAEGLHVGNMYAFTGADIYGRFKRMQGYDVFEPIGLDGFGIHSENYALKIGRHPMEQAKVSEKNFYRQLAILGNGFAWAERLETYDPDYYKWTQWIFVQMFRRGLAYRKKAAVNWCPSCKTVLADEQVIADKCERCGTGVVKKELEQWFFKITDYAERLLKNLDKIDWSERVKIAQRNWIGRSKGALIKFPISESQFSIEVFTTRPDTLFGATYLVLAPEHKIVNSNWLLVTNKEEVKGYIKRAKLKSEEERIAEGKEKTGVELKGVKAINPANNEEIPIWAADYVLGHVGTGAIMAVPAHDQRDFEFAKKYNLPIKIVVCPHYPVTTCPVLDRAYEEEGHLVESGKFNGIPSSEARREIIRFVGGQRKVQYRLRDWLISRQRYWGSPIPMIYCDKCIRLPGGQGWSPVPEKDLPVKLPHIKEFRPTGTSESPLAPVEKFYKVRCPKCRSWARRETDVSDTFLDSAWYYIGYLLKFGNCLPAKALVEVGKLEIGNSAFAKLMRRWLPVDMYIGGAEHSVLHLLYSRFLSMAFHDWGLTHFEEPFTKFRSHGLLIKDGAKMSKSRGNVVNPDDYIRAYGADALRMYLMFLGPFEQGGDFRDTGIRGITRFLERVWRFVQNASQKNPNAKIPMSNQIPNPPPANRRAGKSQIRRTLHRTTKKVSEDIEGLRYNTAISALMILLNEFEANESAITREDINIFLKLLAPFAPHISEELWQSSGKEGNKKRDFRSIHREPWPYYNPALIGGEAIDFIMQVNGKTRLVAEVKRGAFQEDIIRLARGSKALARHLIGEPKKVIFIPDKLINFVV